MNKHVLYYRGSKLDNVSNYKYLGLQFSTYGTFTYAKQEIKKVALKALYKLRKEMGDHFRDDVQLTMKIFDTVITPILTYGSYNRRQDELRHFAQNWAFLRFINFKRRKYCFPPPSPLYNVVPLFYLPIENNKHPNFDWRGQGRGADSFVLRSYPC